MITGDSAVCDLSTLQDLQWNFLEREARAWIEMNEEMGSQEWRGQQQ